MKTDKLTLRYIFTHVLFLFLSYSVSGNSTQETSSQPSISSITSTQQLDSLYIHSFSIYSTNPEIARTNALRIIDLSQKMHYLKGEGNGNNLLGVISKSVDGDYEKALGYYNKALPIRKKTGTDTDIANMYINISRCLYQQGKTKEALFNSQEGLQLIETDSLSPSKSGLYVNLSDILTQEKRYREAIFYLDKSYEILKKSNDSNLFAEYYRNRAHLCTHLNNNICAREYYEKALKIYLDLDYKQGIFDCYNGLASCNMNEGYLDQALFYFLKAYKLRKNTNAYIQAILDRNLGNLYTNKEDYTTALGYYKSAQNGFLENQLYHNVAKTFIPIASINSRLGENKKAEEQLLKGLDYLYKYDKDVLLETQFLSELSELYLEQGKTQLAFNYNQKYISLKDSINTNLLEASNLQNNLEIKEKENVQLQNQILEQDQKQLWSRGLAALSVLFGLFMTAGFVAYRNRQKRLVAEFEADQAYLQIDDIIRQQELSLAYAKLETRDEMQKQIGQDLHDRLGVMLSTIKLYFGEFVDELKDLNIKSSQHQDKTIELLDEAVVEVRRIAHNMQSGILKNFGLLNAVQDLGKTITQTGKLKVTVSNFGMKDRLANDLEGKVFKIIQELVGNVLKHAKATTLGISLYKKDDLLNIIVEDNGIGFNTAEISEKGGMGLKNITFRVAELGGKCHFDSNEKAGTSVIIDIPIENTEV